MCDAGVLGVGMFATCSALSLAVVLLVHHKLKHGDPASAEYLPSSSEQWFQRSDVGKCRSHECWVLLLLTTSFATALVLLLVCTL